MPKLIRVQLSSGQIREEQIEGGHPLEFYAGRSLTSQIVATEVSADADALGVQNKLIFSPGFLTATQAPNSGRLSIGAKSPLTGGIKESNVGGRAPSMLGLQDIRGIICEEQAKDWVILKVENSHVEILDGKPFVGLNNYTLVAKIFELYGSKVGALTIGTGGERQFAAASVASIDMEGFPSRHAGRGGLGAVMGSKHIKAIVVLPIKSQLIKYQDPTTFKGIASSWFQNLYNTRRNFAKFGTNIGLLTVNEHHGLPTQNFRYGSFRDAEKISGEALNAYIVKFNGKCGIPCSPGCAIQCSNLIRDADGKHITSSLEYETVALNGSNLLINNIEKIAKIDQITDDVGVDSIEMGNTLAIMMEAGKIQWGDADEVIRWLEKLRSGEKDAEMLGLGCYQLGKRLGVSRICHSLHQGIPAYDPRTFKGMGVTYCTSPMGADHTAGPAVVNRKAYLNKEYGQLDDPETKIDLSKELQIFLMLLDSAGICYFVGPSNESVGIIVKLIAARYGWSKSWEDWIQWARKCLLTEHKFNIQAGLSPDQQQLPEFMQREPLLDYNQRWDIDPITLKRFWDKF